MDTRPARSRSQPYAQANPYLAEKPHSHPLRLWSALPYFRRHRRSLLIALTALVLAVAVLGRLGGAALEASGAPVSDPASQWQQGQVPQLYQIDPAWSEKPYAGATIGSSGCGPTCLSAVYIALTGQRDRGPVEMAALAEKDGHVTDGLTAWTLMDQGAATLGLTSRSVPASADAVASELAAGHPLIASVGPGDFTTSGHFIVLTSLDGNGRLHVMDPNSKPRTHQSWDLGRVMAQTRGLWSFSAL